MRIILDIMSGDKAPLEMLKGAVDAAAQDYSNGVDFTLVGDENVIKRLAEENKLDVSGFEIRHTEVVLTMDDDPMAVMKEKKDSSLALGLRMLADGEGDAFVSCGNTGALFCGSSLIVKRVKGIQRAAIGAILPLTKPMMLMDSGASVKVNEDYLHQFAIMGSAYMKAIYGVENPAVGMVNNGSEEHKGGELQQAAYPMLKKSKFINFIGNVEGNQIPAGYCDVAVCDGFVGNIVLKTAEGMGKLLSAELKTMFKSGLGGILAYLLLKKKMASFKKKFDSTEHGGAPILGLSKTVIKAHGSSNAKAFKNAIRQAIGCERAGVVSIIAETAAEYSAEKKKAKAEIADAE
ncbi:MAG: phosphate acyltransferase PlsX [Ruminococcaceae bacterium]|nr:phosphate acyltransferase PlsX [Oscillospiraceae bacterium]